MTHKVIAIYYEAQSVEVDPSDHVSYIAQHESQVELFSGSQSECEVWLSETYSGDTFAKVIAA
jgi:hypothetical protein